MRVPREASGIYLNVLDGSVFDVLVSDVHEHDDADQATVLYEGIARALRR